jgi:hypothetical protein
MPQNRISICTSCSVGSRRAIVVEASGDVALAAEYAFALYMEFLSLPDLQFEMSVKRPHTRAHRPFHSRDYANRPVLRYPDPAYSLPISLARGIFMHT